MILKLEEKLKQFGKVEVCEVRNNKLYIKITEGYYDTPKTAMKVFDVVTDGSQNEFKRIDSIVTDENLFHCVFVKELRKDKSDWNIQEIKPIHKPGKLYTRLSKEIDRDVQKMFGHFAPSLFFMESLNKVLRDNGITWSK